MSTDNQETRIRLHQPARPLTSSARPDPDYENHWAQSHAYRTLKSQLERYADGKIRGHSFLIAGYRGGGKTTTVHLAIQAVRWLAQGKTARNLEMEVDLKVTRTGHHASFKGNVRGGEYDHEVGFEVDFGNGTAKMFEMRLPPVFGRTYSIQLPWNDSFFSMEDELANSSGKRRTLNMHGDLTLKLEGQTEVNVKMLATIGWTGSRSLKFSTNLYRFDSCSQNDATLTGTIRGTWSEAMAAIPFLVPLSGPDLFDGDGTFDDSSKPERVDRMAERALWQITKSLHRAFVNELIDHFDSGLPETRAHRELAAQLRIELDGAPTVADLRTYWEKAGFLERGILGKLRCESLSLTPQPAVSQGIRELLALHTAVDAVRIVQKGEADREAKHLKALIESHRRTTQTDGQPPPVLSPHGHIEAAFQNPLGTPTVRVAETVRVAAPIVSILSGFYAASTVVDPLGPITAGAIGIITVLLVYLFLSRTGVSEDSRTLGDRPSMPSLDLLLPVLLQRIFDAGFAPIFVVDEMDKVGSSDTANEAAAEAKTDRQLKELMGRIKYLVTDQAVFCFLTDRKYYDRFVADLRKKTYPLEETFFSDRLLVHHEPRDLHAYLAKRLQVNSPERGVRSRDDTIALYPYVLVAQSKCHVGNLERIMSANVRAGSLVLEHTGGSNADLRAAFRVNAYVGAAIGAVFESPEISRRIKQDPDFSARVADSLCGKLVASWQADRAQDTYYTDLVTPGGGEDKTLDNADRDLLVRAMDRFCAYLSGPADLALDLYEYQRPEIAQSVAQSLALAEPRNHTPDGPNTLTWRVNQYGLLFSDEQLLVKKKLHDDWHEALSKLDDDIFTVRQKLVETLQSIIEPVQIDAFTGESWRIMVGTRELTRESAKELEVIENSIQQNTDKWQRLVAREVGLHRTWKRIMPLIHVACLEGCSCHDLLTETSTISELGEWHASRVATRDSWPAEVKTFSLQSVEFLVSRKEGTRSPRV